MEITWRVTSGEGENGGMGEKVQGLRSINGRYKIDRLRIVQEMEKPKNLYVQPKDMNQGEGMLVGGGVQGGGE